MPSSKTRYKSYLLRFWQENETGPWRARLASIGQDNEVKHFADASKLMKLVNSDLEDTKAEHKVSLMSKPDS